MTFTRYSHCRCQAGTHTGFSLGKAVGIYGSVLRANAIEGEQTTSSISLVSSMSSQHILRIQQQGACRRTLGEVQETAACDHVKVN